MMLFLFSALLLLWLGIDSIFVVLLTNKKKSLSQQYVCRNFSSAKRTDGSSSDDDSDEKHSSTSSSSDEKSKAKGKYSLIFLLLFSIAHFTISIGREISGGRANALHNVLKIVLCVCLYVYNMRLVLQCGPHGFACSL